MPREIDEPRSFSPWTSRQAPGKILIVRMQAVGDVVITLPACSALRQRFPDSQIDFLTSDVCQEIPQAIRLFDHVYSMPRRNGRWTRACRALIEGARMRGKHYDVILDLQRHRASRLIRRMARPRAWGEFDRFSPRHALERVVDTFQRTGFAGLQPLHTLDIREEVRASSRRILKENGWDGKGRLVILNPAGLWVTRNWPLERWVELANLWSGTEAVVFLFLGTERMTDKAAYLKENLGCRGIDLTGKTTLAQALGIVQCASAVISEDSGLLHLAWVSGIPTVGLLGSTRSDWSRPLGDRSRFVASEDLPCGACMEAACKFGDVHCLTRYSADSILRLAREVAGRALNP
jgi:heptosyltransferase-2